MKETIHYFHIDSLRGIAVILIILFHFNYPVFIGGFVGVDIFFVISGFLITGKITTLIDANKFSYLEFYANRIRRIFPALFVLLIIVLLFEWIFFDYQKLKSTGTSVVSISVFLSNVLFWYQSGYFDNISIENPLLHTWSLSVEEQFYFVLPLVFVLGKRFLPMKFTRLLVVIAGVSFLLFILGTIYFQDVAFYLLPTRIWEFLTGAFLSVILLERKHKIKHLNLLGVAGFILLVISLYLNFIHLLPISGSIFLAVISSAFIILSGFDQESLLNKILNREPLIFIGKISYSLYLWHWPVFCFARYSVINELDAFQVAGCFIITLILAWLSWYFIENPFRYKAEWIKRKSLAYAFFFTGSCLLFVTGFCIYLKNGFPKRFEENEKLLIINKHVGDMAKRQEILLSQFENGKVSMKLGEQNKEGTFLIWGDSHALGFATVLDTVAKQNHAAGFFLTKSGTVPILEVKTESNYGDEMLTFNRSVLAFIKAHKEIRTIFLSCRWSSHFEGSYVNETSSRLKYVDISSETTKKEGEDLLSFKLKETVKTLLTLNRRVVIINQIPEQKYDVAKYFIKKRIYTIFHQQITVFPTTADDYQKRNRSINNLFVELDKFQNVTVLRIDKIFRSGGNFLNIVDNQPLYTDNNHLSFYGLNYTRVLFEENSQLLK